MTTRPRFPGRVCLLACLGLITACSQASDTSEGRGLGGYNLDAGSLRQWKLPNRLREISGLALTPDQRLFAVTDEAAVIYELDYEAARIKKAFALGDPVVKADFEGLAYLNETIYAVTSDGRIFEAREGNDGEKMQYQRYDTGLGKLCEIEGLAQDPKSNLLLISCKQSRSKKSDGLFIFAWSPSTGEVAPDREIVIPYEEVANKLDKKRISPSAIVVDPRTSDLYLAAARERAIFSLSPNGDLIDAIILPLAKRHRQTEGIEITRDGRLLLADEGGTKKARLGIYEPGPIQATDQRR